MNVNVLGTIYTVGVGTEKTDPKLSTAYGYCDPSVKKIVISELERDPDSVQDLDAEARKILRHEIIHAFFFESGLHENCDYAANEELVDWIALQFPKILHRERKILEKK